MTQTLLGCVDSLTGLPRAARRSATLADMLINLGCTHSIVYLGLHTLQPVPAARWAWFLLAAPVVYAYHLHSARLLAQRIAPTGTVHTSVAETLAGQCVGLALAAQAACIGVLLAALPAPAGGIAQAALNGAYTALVSAYVAFEPRLIAKSLSITQRMHFLETRWPYALGFGLLASAAWSSTDDPLLALNAWQLCVGLLRVSAARLSALTDVCPVSDRWRIRFFAPAVWLAHRGLTLASARTEPEQ